MGMQPTPSGFP
jgi:hypothetical protein